MPGRKLIWTLLLVALRSPRPLRPQTRATRWRTAATRCAPAGKFVPRAATATRPRCGRGRRRAVPHAGDRPRPLPALRQGGGLPRGAGAGERRRRPAQPSEHGGLAVDEPASGALHADARRARQGLAVGDGGTLVDLADTATRSFAFERADGCAVFPEVESTPTGEPLQGRDPLRRGRAASLDAHMHMMAFEFLGGSAHCGRPWHRYGVDVRARRLPRPRAERRPRPCSRTRSTASRHAHDPVGWPTFKDWPHHELAHPRAVYYKWLERAWRGGLRVFVNLLVDNAVLCEVYPLKTQLRCNEMDSVRLQLKRHPRAAGLHRRAERRPGQGLVPDRHGPVRGAPRHQRRQARRGPRHRGLRSSSTAASYNDVPDVRPRSRSTAQLDEVYELGRAPDGARQQVRQRARRASPATAARPASSSTPATSTRPATSGTCRPARRPRGVTTSEQPSTGEPQRDALRRRRLARRSCRPAPRPSIPTPPHCNKRGLTDLGEHLVRRMIDEGDDLRPRPPERAGAQRSCSRSSRRAGLLRRRLEPLLEHARRATRGSTSSAASIDAVRRRLDRLRRGVEGARKPLRDPRFYFGFGYGADMNGFGAPGRPARRRRRPNPVSYPFKSFDGRSTIDKQQSGERVYDINADGVAHYGLYPGLDRGPAQARRRRDRRGHGARRRGLPADVGARRRRARPRLPLGARHASPAAASSSVRLGRDAEALLRRAGQPRTRPGRAWTLVRAGHARRAPGGCRPVFTPRWRVGAGRAPTRSGHRALRAAVGAGARSLEGTRAFGSGVRVRNAAARRRVRLRRAARPCEVHRSCEP